MGTVKEQINRSFSLELKHVFLLNLWSISETVSKYSFKFVIHRVSSRKAQTMKFNWTLENEVVTLNYFTYVNIREQKKVAGERLGGWNCAHSIIVTPVCTPATWVRASNWFMDLPPALFNGGFHPPTHTKNLAHSLKYSQISWPALKTSTWQFWQFSHCATRNSFGSLATLQEHLNLPYD